MLGRTNDALRGPLCHDKSTGVAGFRAQVDDPIGRLDDVQIMFHDDHGITEIDKAIIDNKGVNCVGEQVKTVLKKELGKGEVSPPAAAPETPKAAFAHSVKEASGEFIKSTVIVLC